MQFGSEDDQAMLENSLDPGFLRLTSGSSTVATVTSTIPASTLDIKGGAGNDVIIIGDIDNVIASRMVVDGQAGNDDLSAAPSRFAVSMTGGAGVDRMSGNNGNDTLLGGDDDDTLYGGSGSDTLLGEFGSDLVNGQGSNDLIAGGHGDGEAQTGDRLIGPESEIDENFIFTAAWIEEV